MRGRRRLFGMGVASIFASVVSCVVVAQASAAWTLTPVALPKPVALNGVAASSPYHIWAVGYLRNRYGMALAAILRRDRSGWHGDGAVNLGDPRKTSNALDAVVAVSDRDVWAFGGSEQRTTHQSVPLIEHTTGAGWSVVAGPQVHHASLVGACRRLSAGPPRLWAVGYRDVNGVPHPLIEHWDGRTWTTVPVPPTSGGLTSCVAMSPTDAWAVGAANMLHWNGSVWSVTSTNGGFNAITPTSTLGHSTLWAVGGGTQRWQAGQGWQPVDPGDAANARLTGVTAMPHDLWASGYYQQDSQDYGTLVPTIYHSTGASWALVATLLPTGDYAATTGIARVPGTDRIWVVGTYTNGSGTFIAEGP